MKKKELISVAKDLSGIVDFDIDIKKLDEYEEKTIRAEIIEAAVVLEDGDKIKQSTADALAELEVDIPAGIKIIKGTKMEKPKKSVPKETKTSKKTSKKSSSKKVQKETSKPKKVERSNDLKDKLVELLKEKRYSQKEIKEMLLDEFPEKSPSTISTLLSDVKNEKWCSLERLVVVDSKGIMRFK